MLPLFEKASKEYKYNFNPLRATKQYGGYNLRYYTYSLHKERGTGNAQM